MARQQTQGNPLAAGLIAFGVGWLVSSILPATQREQQLAEQAVKTGRQKAQDLASVAQQGGTAVAVAATLGRPVAGPVYDSLATTPLAFGVALLIVVASPSLSRPRCRSR